MQGVKVLIVEDDLVVAEELAEILTENDYQVVGPATSLAQAMELVKENPPDIALLDINLKGDGDGIDLAQHILKAQQCAIIFLTAHDDQSFLKRAQKIKPAAYIVKPFEERNLKVAIDMGFANLLETPQESESIYRVENRIFVKHQSRFKKLDVDDILFAEAVGSYTKVKTTGGSLTLSFNLKNFEAKLDHPKFMRVHRSYLVNMDRVDEFEGNSIFLNGSTIPLSNANKDNFLRRLKLF